MNLYNLLILALIPGIIGAIVDTDQELICETENDCYPKVLIPTREWQPIRKDQDIPAGLHVRLNIDTLEREAKILDEEDDDNMGQQQYDLAVHENQEEVIEDAIAPTGKIDSYDSAVKEVMYGKDEVRLAEALDILVDISHDVEYGEKLTNEKQPFQQLLKLVHSYQDRPQIVDAIYRVVGTSLRNNPEAIKNFLNVQHSPVIADLISQLSNPKFNDKIQKRILGIIQGLLQNDSFRFTYFNINDLISKYDILGPESKLRFINILEDLGLSKRFEDGTNADEYFSNYLQSKLVSQDFDNTSQFENIFDELTKLHENNKSLQPSSDFMQWLSTEVETRKDNNKRDEQEIEFDQEMLRRRHEVFGNPNAMRKAMMDEL